MKRYALIFITALLMPLAVQAQQLCTVRATVYDAFGSPASQVEFKIRRAQLVGGTYIVSRAAKSEFTDTNGKLEFTTFRDAYINIQANTVDSLYYGKNVYIPDQDSVNLIDLPIGSPTIPDRYVVALGVTPLLNIYHGDTLKSDSTESVIFSDNFHVTETADGTVFVDVDLSGITVPDTLHAYVLGSIIADVNTNAAGIASNAADLVTVESKRDTTGKFERASLQSDAATASSTNTSQDGAIIGNTSDILALYDSTYLATLRLLAHEDQFTTVLAMLALKLDADTADIAALLDPIYSRSPGSSSEWTDAGTHDYNADPLSLGTSDHPDGYGVWVGRNVGGPKDSVWNIGKVKTPMVVLDASGRTNYGDTLIVKHIGGTEETFTMAHVRTREVVLEVEHAAYSVHATDPCYRIVSDSANGWWIAGVQIETWSYSYFNNSGNGDYPQVVGYYECQLMNNSTTALAWNLYELEDTGPRRSEAIIYNTTDGYGNIAIGFQDVGSGMWVTKSKITVRLSGENTSESSFYATVTPAP